MNVNLKNGKLIVGDEIQIAFDEICNSVCASDTDIVYLGGSLIEGRISSLSKGMGNRYSDIDVFIIRDHLQFLQTDCVYDDVVRKTFFCNDLPIGLDVEVYDKEYVDSLISAIDAIEINSATRIANVFSKYLNHGDEITFINSFLCRLSNSICVCRNENYNKLLSKINLQKFLDILKDLTIIETDDIFYDLYGNLDSNQLDVALYCARKVVLNVMRIVLMNNGCFSDREKWVFLKFQNMSMQENEFMPFYENACILFRGGLQDDMYCRQVIEKSIHASKKEIEKIVLGECAL